MRGDIKKFSKKKINNYIDYKSSNYIGPNHKIRFNLG